MSLVAEIQIDIWDDEAGEGLKLSTDPDFPDHIKIIMDNGEDIVIPMGTAEKLWPFVYMFISMVNDHEEQIG